MSESAVMTAEDPEVSQSLPDRLDSAIGEASSGIGMMMSELVRRSLRSGVADIERTLADVTAEKVELAVELQMPAISEAAHRVAETTSARLVKTVVTESEERSHKQLQAAVTESEERSQQQLQSAVTNFEEVIKQTSAESRDGVAQTTQSLAELETRAQSSWKKVKAQFARVDAEFQKTKTDLADVTSENSQLKQNLSDLSRRLQDVSKFAEQKLQAFADQNLQLQARLEELEKPRGLKAMWQKLRPGKKKNIDGPEE